MVKLINQLFGMIKWDEIAFPDANALRAVTSSWLSIAVNTKQSKREREQEICTSDDGYQLGLEPVSDWLRKGQVQYSKHIETRPIYFVFFFFFFFFFFFNIYLRYIKGKFRFCQYLDCQNEWAIGWIVSIRTNLIFFLY